MGDCAHRPVCHALSAGLPVAEQQPVRAHRSVVVHRHDDRAFPTPKPGRTDIRKEVVDVNDIRVERPKAFRRVGTPSGGNRQRCLQRIQGRCLFTIGIPTQQQDIVSSRPKRSDLIDDYSILAAWLSGRVEAVDDGYPHNAAANASPRRRRRMPPQPRRDRPRTSAGRRPSAREAQQGRRIAQSASTPGGRRSRRTAAATRNHPA